MDPEQPAAPTPAPARQRKKRKKRPPRRQCPAFAQLILWSVDFSKSCGGFSLGAIEKELAATGVDVPRNKSRIKAALKKLVANNILYKVPGATGVGGFYKSCKDPAVSKTQLALQLPEAKKQKRRGAKKPPAKQEAKKVKKRSKGRGIKKVPGARSSAGEGKGATRPAASSARAAPQRKS